MPRYIICKFCKNENEATALLLLVGKEMKMKILCTCSDLVNIA
jgi:hypothetical protein